MKCNRGAAPATSPRSSCQRSGFTLLELLIVIVILGAIAGVGVFVLPDDSSRTANEVARLVQQARFESVKREAATAVLWNESAQQFEVRVGADTCLDAGTLVRTLPMDERRGVDINVTIAGGGLIWLPSNIARDCDNGIFTGTSAGNDFQIVGRTRTFVVAVSAAGFVSVE